MPFSLLRWEGCYHKPMFLFSFSKSESLSELRDYTESLADNGKEEERQEHCLPQASGMSGQSVISLLSPEELKKLIEEVKSLDEATLKVSLLFSSKNSQTWES